MICILLPIMSLLEFMRVRELSLRRNASVTVPRTADEVARSTVGI